MDHYCQFVAFSIQLDMKTTIFCLLVLYINMIQHSHILCMVCLLLCTPSQFRASLIWFKTHFYCIHLYTMTVLWHTSFKAASRKWQVLYNSHFIPCNYPCHPYNQNPIQWVKLIIEQFIIGCYFLCGLFAFPLLYHFLYFLGFSFCTIMINCKQTFIIYFQHNVFSIVFWWLSWKVRLTFL